jgi:hypothetical protein
MKKAPGWKTTLGTAVAMMTMGLGANNADAPSQQSRPVFNQQPSQIERVQPRTSRSDTDSTAKGSPKSSTQTQTAPTDSASKAYSITDSLEQQVQRTDSINAATPSVNFIPGNHPSQKQSTASPTNPPTDTVFVDNTTYSEAGNDDINTITRVDDNTAYLTITTQDDSTIAEDFPANIQTNESLNTAQGRKALKNAGWTPTKTSSTSQSTIDFLKNPAGDETTTQTEEANNITFTQHDADLDSLYDEAITRPFHFNGVDDNHVAQAITAKQHNEPNQHYILSEPVTSPDQHSEGIASSVEDIYGSLLGPIAGAHNDPSEIDSPAEQRANDWLNESIATHLAYIEAQEQGTNTIKPTVTPDEINAEFNDYGFITNVTVDDDNLTDRELASEHPSVHYNTRTGEAEPTIYFKGGQEPSTPTNGIIRTDEAAPTYESLNDDVTSLEAAIQGSQQKAQTVLNDARPPGQQDTVYVNTETDPVNAVSLGPTYDAAQGPGGTINIHHGNWEFGVDVNYQDDALDQTTSTTGEIRGPLNQDFIPRDGVTIVEGSRFAPVSQSKTTGEALSIAPQIGYDITDDITARIGVGATRLTETTTSSQLYVADPSKQPLQSQNPVENSVYAGTLSEPTVSEETTIAPNAEIDLTYDLNDHFTVNSEVGYDGALNEPTYSAGFEYNIGGN